MPALRKKRPSSPLAALAEADQHNVFIQESGRHNATEADKDNAFKRFTSWTSDKVKSTNAWL